MMADVPGQQYPRVLILRMGEPGPRTHSLLELQGMFEVLLRGVEPAERPRQHAETARYRAEYALDGSRR